MKEDFFAAKKRKRTQKRRGRYFHREHRRHRKEFENDFTSILPSVLSVSSVEKLSFLFLRPFVPFRGESSFVFAVAMIMMACDTIRMRCDVGQ